MDSREIRLSGRSVPPLCITAEPGIDFSLRPYTRRALDAAGHQSGLKSEFFLLLTWITP